MTNDRSRITVIGIVFMLLGAAVIARLGYLQMLRHEYFAVLATESQSRKFEIPARRGKILMQDRGEATSVAMNRNLKTLYADTRYIYDRERTIRRLKDATGKDYSEEIIGASGYKVLEKEITRQTAETIARYNLSGIGLSDNFTRVYPEGRLGSQLMGFVNQDGEGQYGVEGALDEILAGTPGLLSAETNAQGNPIVSEENVQRPARDGRDVVLTIDRNIQAFVESALRKGVKEMGARSGHALVMDPDTGKVLAMANNPAYNPNHYQQVEDYQRFRNAIVSQQFEPGSGFKVFTMAAGLESGGVTPGETYYDSGSVEIDGYRITNALGGDQTRTMTDVITHSVNTGAVYVLTQLSDEGNGTEITDGDKRMLREYFVNRFRLTQPTGIAQPSEPDLRMDAPGNVSDVNYANMAFGQGITTTMARMATSMGAIINGGTLYKPHMVAHYRARGEVTRRFTSDVVDDNVVSDRTSRQIRAMMETVVEEGGGYGVRIDDYRVGGKTGTAQIPDPEGGYYENRDIGTFTGFAPVEDPEFVVMVRMDEPTVPGFAGSAAAGPVFGDIMEQLLQYKGVPPSE